MIHFRRTIQIAPGMQAEAIARSNAFNEAWKDLGVDFRTSVAITGTLGWLCQSADFESMAAYEASWAALRLNPRAVALWTMKSQEVPNGVSMFIEGTHHDEFWRDA